MKHKTSYFVFIMLLSLLLMNHTAVFAEEAPVQAQLPSTVYTSTEITKPSAEPTPEPVKTPEPTPKIILYPVEVQEYELDGKRQIMKIYELTANESPDNIDTGTFERNGWRYSITDIIKKETANASVRERIETKTIDTATKEMADILALLEPSIQFKDEDGYEGILHLDISSIKCETAGYKSSSYTTTETREYPNLSHNDTSFIPKTITVNGKTLTLADVTWQAQNTTAVDYDPIPDTYKAIAKYTATGTTKSVTGYTTTAEYKGQLSKLITGKTVYATYFTGKEINPPTPTPSPTPEPTPTPMPEPEPVERKPIGAALPIAAGATAGTGLVAGCVFFFFLRRNVKVFNLKDGKFTPIGKTRVAYKNPIIDLTGFSDKAATGNFILVLDKYAAKKLNGQMLTINYGEKSFQHIVDGGDGEYEFEVDF